MEASKDEVLPRWKAWLIIAAMGIGFCLLLAAITLFMIGGSDSCQFEGRVQPWP